MSLVHFNQSINIVQQQQQQHQSQQQDQQKKRTRRRLRVSCVECTRRRQKCDRKQPCGLCKTRKVEHLCRWETEPYARPPPARPPGTHRACARKDKQQHQHHQPQQQSPDVVTDWQIPASSGSSTGGSPAASTPPYVLLSSPRQLLLSWRGAVSAPTSPSQASLVGTIARRSLGPPVRQNEGLKVAAYALASMCLEDRQLEGPLAYALQEFTDPAPTARIYEVPLSAFPQSSYAIIRPSDTFIPRLPDKAHCHELLLGFDEHVNWSIGIPSNVLFSSHEKMWAQITADPTCLQRFNPNWLALLFAIFAFSPRCETEEESRGYFNQALALRKLEEDKCSSLDSPTPPMDFRGAVYTCLATAFLARYLQDRGRVTEAWRVVGSGLRDAQNAGLHRFLAPGKARHLANDERTFMLVGWHLCVEFDRYLSLFLGRPTVVRSRDCNVQLPTVSSNVLALDGSTNTALLFQYYFISLTRSVSEAKERFLSEIPEDEDGHAYFDARMVQWLSSLPSYYKLDQPPDESYCGRYPKLYFQRLTLNSYYSCSCLLYHRALAYTKPSHDPSGVVSYGMLQQQAWDQSQLAQYAINVLHAQTQLMHENRQWERQVPFDISMYMFEAAVTLGVTLLRYPQHSHAGVWGRELADAVEVLESLRERDFGKIVSQAIEVLRVLLDLCDDALQGGGSSKGDMNGNGHGGNGSSKMDYGGSGMNDAFGPNVFDPAAMQEEAKAIFEMGAFGRDDHTFRPTGGGATTSTMFGNAWVQQQYPMNGMNVAGSDPGPSSGPTSGPAPVPAPATVPIAPPSTPISAGSSLGHNGYSAVSPSDSPYMSFNTHVHTHSAHSATYPMWPHTDDYMMPASSGFDNFNIGSLSPEAAINVQYA